MSDSSIGKQNAGEPVTVDPTVVDPVTVAQVLIKSLNENTVALRKVKRRQWLIFAVLGLVVAGFTSNRMLYNDIRRVQTVACENGNNTRQGLLNVADFIETADTSSPEFIASLRRDFALVKC